MSRRKIEQRFVVGKRKSRGIKNINPKDLIGVTKTPVHLVSPIAIVQESIANFLGATKYGAWNWRAKDTAASVYYAAAMRHMFLWWCGEDMDSDGTPHLTNARCCLAIIMEGMVIGNMTDDRPPAVDLKSVMKEIEAMMPLITKKYGHMNPKHWTIKDKTHARKKA
jgi:hypothetical protein